MSQKCKKCGHRTDIAIVEMCPSCCVMEVFSLRRVLDAAMDVAAQCEGIPDFQLLPEMRALRDAIAARSSE